MAITANIYPPLVQDTLPAFIRTKTCKVYFSLSIYDSATDIKNVQISLINQRNNASALKVSDYPSGIKIANMVYDPQAKGDYNYYVQINPADLEQGEFGLNQFYKVQLRFTSTAAADPPSSGTELATWLYENMQYFSEWSRVCLIRGIEQPHIYIRGFDDSDGSQETVLASPMFDIIGEMTYLENNTIESEYLKSYNIKIYQANDMDTVLVDTGDVFTNPYNPNEFNYEISYGLLDGVNYVLVFTYTTNNLYTETINYNFTIIQYEEIDKLNADITAEVDADNGRIKVSIVSKDDKKFIGNVTIRRTSSESNFHKWEDIKTITFAEGTKLNYTWYDTTIESGVWYKYCAQRRNIRGDRGTIIQIDAPVICLLDDIFLTRDGCQLKIQLNPSLNEFKYNVTESQQVTIGSKFPFIKRNGANYFRSFPIGGLISSFIDTTDWYDPHFYDGEFHYDENEIKAFTSKAQIYKDTQSLYDNYNSQNRINEYNDYIYEREFREKVYDFLYAHNAKLFRSTTEGNILVKLMNIDFQPVESLGRQLYSFTATAVEIDDATIDNYDKYGIQDVGSYSKNISYTYDIIGQIQGSYQLSDGNLLTNAISPKYPPTDEQFVSQVTSLKWLRIQMESQPYVIIEKDGQLVKADDQSEIGEDATLGYIVIINNVEMIIGPSGLFELTDPNTSVTDLKFKYPSTATIDYLANIKESENVSRIVNTSYYYHKAGQLYGTFEPYDSLMEKIYNRYSFDYTKYYQRLLDISGVKIEAPEGTVVYVKDSENTNFNRHVLANGYLQLQDDEATIEGLYFCGTHLEEFTGEDVSKIGDNEYVLIEDEHYESLDEITNPVKNGVYWIVSYFIDQADIFEKINNLLTVSEDITIAKADKDYALIIKQIYEDPNNRYIYYNNKWYLFTPDHVALCPVEGLVDYYVEIVKGVY